MYYVRDPRLKTLIIYCLIQRFNENESLGYLKAEGYDITVRTLERIKKKIKEDESSRLNEIAKSGFVSQHLERIDQLELIQKEMWSRYYQEKDPSKQVAILLTLAQIQPYLSQYYESSKDVMEDRIKSELNSKDKSNTKYISETTEA